MQNNKNNGQMRSWNNQNSENVKKGARLKVIAWVIFAIILLFGELLGFGLAAAIRNTGGFAFYFMDNIGLQFIIGVIVMIATPIIGFLSMIKIRAIGDFYKNMGK